MNLFLFCSRKRERENISPILIRLTGGDREFENFFIFCSLKREREREREFSPIVIRLTHGVRERV